MLPSSRHPSASPFGRRHVAAPSDQRPSVRVRSWSQAAAGSHRGEWFGASGLAASRTAQLGRSHYCGAGPPSHPFPSPWPASSPRPRAPLPCPARERRGAALAKRGRSVPPPRLGGTANCSRGHRFPSFPPSCLPSSASPAPPSEPPRRTSPPVPHLCAPR